MQIRSQPYAIDIKRKRGQVPFLGLPLGLRVDLSENLSAILINPIHDKLPLLQLYEVVEALREYR